MEPRVGGQLASCPRPPAQDRSAWRDDRCRQLPIGGVPDTVANWPGQACVRPTRERLVYESANYPTSLEEAEAFASGQHHGTLVVAGGGWPQVSILPFVKDGDRISLHAVRADPTCRALRETDRATFFVSEFLAFTPHDWVDARNAARGTLHFRAISYECRAAVDDDPEAVAAVLRRILERYEPGTTYEPLVDGEYYGPRLRKLSAITLVVVERKAKFKVGPYGPDSSRLDIARRLRDRGLPHDVDAAEVIEAAVSRDDPSAAG